MRVKDPIYGEFEITEKIILDLIATKPFQRLKNINQYGGVNLIFSDSYQTTRYEHSIGVWHATKQLGGNLEEQVAALLHDLGHMAFSHMVDQAKDDPLELTHEASLEMLDGYEEVKQILAGHKLSLDDVDNYPLIKTSLPNIGTDRLDYALRDYECVYKLGDHLGKTVVANAKRHNGIIVFSSQDIAREFALRANQAMYAVIYDPMVSVVYQALVDMLRIGFEQGWLKDHHLLAADRDVFELFENHKKDMPEKALRLFEQPYNVVETQDDYDFKHVKLKVRWFDPQVEVDEDIQPLSKLDLDFAQQLGHFKDIFERRKQGVGYKVIF